MKIENKKEQKKRNGVFSKIKIIISIPLILITLYFVVYTGIEKKYNTKGSVNPEATKHFVHATTVTFFINLIHSISWLDFNNSIFKPAYIMRDYFFEKGEKLVQENNAENVLWWRVNYFEFYAFIQTERNDRTMAIYKRDRDTRLEFKTKLYHYILKLSNYPVKGEVFAPITNLQDKVGGLLNSFKSYTYLLYSGNSKLEQSINFFKDPIQKERYTNIYKSISKLDVNDDLQFVYNKNLILGSLLMFELHTQTISKETCFSKELYEYLSTVKKLYFWAKDSKNVKTEYRDMARAFLSMSPGVKNSVSQVTMDMVSFLCHKDTPSLKLIKEINNKDR